MRPPCRARPERSVLGNSVREFGNFLPEPAESSDGSTALADGLTVMPVELCLVPGWHRQTEKLFKSLCSRVSSFPRQQMAGRGNKRWF